MLQQQPSVPTTISSMDVTSGTNKEWRNPQPLDKEKEGNNLYDQLSMDPRFFPEAPSSYKHCAEILGNAMERLILMGTRSVSLYSSNQPWIT